jgi:hypothetical protein
VIKYLYNTVGEKEGIYLSRKCPFQVSAIDPDEPLENCFVLYWLYDSVGKGLDMVPGDPYYWYRQYLSMPGGCSKTDENGFLELTPLIKNFSFVYGLNNTHYFNYNRGYHAVEFERNSFPQPLYYSDKFPQGRKVGFLIMPLDILNQFETLDLLTLSSKHGA